MRTLCQWKAERRHSAAFGLTIHDLLDLAGAPFRAQNQEIFLRWNLPAVSGEKTYRPGDAEAVFQCEVWWLEPEDGRETNR